MTKQANFDYSKAIKSLKIVKPECRYSVIRAAMLIENSTRSKKVNFSSSFKAVVDHFKLTGSSLQSHFKYSQKNILDPEIEEKMAADKAPIFQILCYYYSQNPELYNTPEKLYAVAEPQMVARSKATNGTGNPNQMMKYTHELFSWVRFFDQVNKTKMMLK